MSCAITLSFIEQACHRSVDSLAKELYCLPFEPYAPIRRQQLELLRVINQERQAAGYEKVPPSVLRYKRRIVSPYEPVEGGDNCEKEAA